MKNIFFYEIPPLPPAHTEVLMMSYVQRHSPVLISDALIGSHTEGILASMHQGFRFPSVLVYVHLMCTLNFLIRMRVLGTVWFFVTLVSLTQVTFH